MYLEENMNDYLSKITEWLSANKLTLISQTEFMLIGSRQRLSTSNRIPSFTIDGNSIKQVQLTKSPGVCIDENPTWNVRMKHIPKKICLQHWHLEEKQIFCSF